MSLQEIIADRPPDPNPWPETSKKSTALLGLMAKARKDLPAYEFLTAFPQIASRLGHKTEGIRLVIIGMMAKVVMAYPQRALWPMVYLMQSNRAERKRLCASVTAQTQVCWPLDELIEAKNAASHSAHQGCGAFLWTLAATL